MTLFLRCFYTLSFALILASCASTGVMVRKTHQTETTPSVAISERFYAVGNASKKESTSTMKAMEELIANDATANKYLLFTGDNVNEKKEEGVINDLDRQLSVVKNQDITAFFIPGNYDWEYDSVDGLEVIEDYLEDQIETNEILTPNNGCPIESVEIGDHVQLIAVDSQWYLEDWDRNPKMNDKCDIKTREKFLLEVENEIKKYANKTILFVMHHPLFTNGFHGGRFSFRDHIFPLQGNIPLPGIASLITEIRSQGAVSVQDRFNKKYNEFAERLIALLDKNDQNIVILSGHEANLQYIEDGNHKQVISGAGSDTRPVSISDNGIFSYGNNGFTVIDRYENGSVWVTFYAVEEGSATEIFRKEVFEATPVPNFDNLPQAYPPTYEASVYDIEKVEKSDFFKSFWGKHYRNVYGTTVTAKTALLDTLYGGLEVIRPGGGHQTKSLRLETKDGKEYNMRGLKKSAIQFLETTAFKNIKGEKYLDNTVPEDLVLDFYTAAHPYGAFAIPKLAKAAAVYYTTPQLFYVPKQKALGKYSDEYGDQLVMIVEKPSGEYTDRKSFGYPDDVESTEDLLAKLREDEDYTLDETAYIRARIFDMLIGDWDRHQDQWRWAEFDRGDDKKVFVPIPRDRDQVFSNFDGSFLNVLRNIMGSVNQFGVYGEDIIDIEWFNKAGSKLDRALLKKSVKNDWVEQAKFLQTAISEETVAQAFNDLPEATQDSTLQEIKEKFLKRKNNLVAIVERYYDVFIQFQMLTGTDKDDYFEITRFEDGSTQIIASRIKDGEKGKVLFNRTFQNETTEEIWLYGLDDDDVFEVKGTAKKPITLRLIGGQDEDTFNIKEGKKVKVYDRNTKNNTVVEKGGAYFRFTDFYEANLYNYKKVKSTNGGINFNVGYNPDLGAVFHAGYSKEKNDFIENPYGILTAISVDYHSLTQGIDARLKKGYAAIFKDYNLIFSGRFTSKNYTENFFGFGNETNNLDEVQSLDYNRTNLAMYNGGVGIERESDYGSYFQLKLDIESVEVVMNGANLINELNYRFFGDRKYFGIPNATYRYKNYDDEVFPTKGMLFKAKAAGIDDFSTDKLTGTFDSEVIFYNALLGNRRLVLKTAAQTRVVLGDMPQFYQLATLGGSNGLRGYRNQRFTGTTSLNATADLGYRFKKIRTFFFPIDLSIYGGVDLGRVWFEQEESDIWHNSYGGGAMFQWTRAIKGGISAFTSDEGTRLEFQMGVSF